MDINQRNIIRNTSFDNQRLPSPESKQGQDRRPQWLRDMRNAMLDRYSMKEFDAMPWGSAAHRIREGEPPMNGTQFAEYVIELANSRNPLLLSELLNNVNFSTLELDPSELSDLGFGFDLSGREIFAKAIKETQRIKFLILDIRDNQFDLTSPMVGLRENSSVDALTLSYVPGMVSNVPNLMSRVLDENSTLQELRLEQSPPAEQDLHAFFKALGNNRYVRYLELEGIVFSANTLQLFCQMLQTNRTLTHIRLDRAACTEMLRKGNFALLCSALEENHVLRELVWMEIGMFPSDPEEREMGQAWLKKILVEYPELNPKMHFQWNFASVVETVDACTERNRTVTWACLLYTSPSPRD